jgi:hypothetical protein
VPLQGSVSILQASLNSFFVLCRAFRTYDVRIAGFLLSVIQLSLQPVSLLLQPFMVSKMIVLELDPILLLTLMLRV